MWILLLPAAMAAPLCDKGSVPDAIRALDSVGPEVQSELAAAWISEACAGSALGEVASQLAASPPDYRPMIEGTVVLKQPDLWLEACTGGIDPLKRSLEVAPAEKRGVLWEGCGLEGKGWFERDEWEGASGLVVLPLSAATALGRSGVSDGELKRVVRALAGIGGDSGGPAGLGEELAPMLRAVEVFDPVEGRAPEPWLLEDGDELEGAAAGLDAGGIRPSFAERPEVKWSRGARKEPGAVCKVEVTVRKAGVFGAVDWVDCPESLRADVLQALERADYRPARAEQTPVRGSFRTRFTVR